MSLKPGDRVRVETGWAIWESGTVTDIAADGWIGVRLDGERRSDLWHPGRVTTNASQQLQYIPVLRGAL